MAMINLTNIKKELLNIIRNSSVLSVTERGVTNKTDSFTAAGGAETFTLSIATALNIHYVKDAGTALVYGTDYTFGYSATTGRITTIIVSKVLTLGHTITINYDYSTSGDYIYPDWARQDITISSVPRLNFDFIDAATSPLCIDAVDKTDFTMQFNVYDTTRIGCETRINTLRELFKTNQTGLYYSNILRNTKYITPKLNGEEGKYKFYIAVLEIANELNVETL